MEGNLVIIAVLADGGGGVGGMGTIPTTTKTRGFFTILYLAGKPAWIQ